MQQLLKACSQSKRVFMAYNANVDYIMHVSPTLEKIAVSFKPKPVLKKKIVSPQDLFSGILYAMQNGEAIEIPAAPALQDWMKQNMLPEKKRVGGQIGIMANHLAFMGLQPLVWVPFLSPEQKKLFNQKILFWDKGLKKSNIIKKKDSTKINWVFEFDRKTSFLGIRAARSTRFVAASRPAGYRLKKILLPKRFDCAILSGFHAIPQKQVNGTTLSQQFRLAARTIRQIKARNKPVHLELAFSMQKQVNRKMLKLAEQVDSLGLDEQELANALEAIGKRAYAKRIRQAHSIQSIVQGLSLLFQAIKTPKIHLHGRGYYLAACQPSYAQAAIVRKALEFASIIAAARIQYPLKSKKDLLKGFKIPISKEGKRKQRKMAGFLHPFRMKKKISIFQQRGFELIMVPTRWAKKVRDIVGLGDIISASIFACEILLLERQKQIRPIQRH